MAACSAASSRRSSSSSAAAEAGLASGRAAAALSFARKRLPRLKPPGLSCASAALPLSCRVRVRVWG